MTNKEISRALKLLAALGELHGENPFKLKSLTNAAFQIDRLGESIHDKSLEELAALPGIGKSIAQKIVELLETGSTEELSAYLEKTPAGVVQLLKVKGLGPKKVESLWKGLQIESPGELLYACYENRLVTLKGFGEKTQESIRKSLEYVLANEGKLHFAEAEAIALELISRITELEPAWKIEFTGELRRKMELIDTIELIADNDVWALEDVLGRSELFSEITTEDQAIQARLLSNHVVLIHCGEPENFDQRNLVLTGPPEHLKEIDLDPEEPVSSEEQFYAERGFPFILPELRDLPLKDACEIDTNKLVTMNHIRGVLHNHSTWSDGADTLEVMAKTAQALGYEYLGICDHSKSAGYAGGLSIERVFQQWQEIDQLNTTLQGFTILKGIESDILSDGSLDYPEEVLKGFDLVVASVHSVLNMDEQRATSRLIKAIENPYTKILGHPTGRLLLSRKGYPIDHKMVIDACAANGVIMELNAHPYRLDIDWRWIPYCMEKGVKISINPDAHRKEGYADMRYGIEVARKGGLSSDFLFNGLKGDQLKDLLKNW